ncbi:MAG: hypothetical protein WCA06_20150 [Terrimicrobiaceae bacterium]
MKSAIGVMVGWFFLRGLESEVAVVNGGNCHPRRLGAVSSYTHELQISDVLPRLGDAQWNPSESTCYDGTGGEKAQPTRRISAKARVAQSASVRMCKRVHELRSFCDDSFRFKGAQSTRPLTS